MEKKIDNYLPFYFGCSIEISYISYTTKKDKSYIKENFEIFDLYIHRGDVYTLKPILRKLTSITDEEISDFHELKLGWVHLTEDKSELVFEIHGGHTPNQMSETLIQLRKRGFDCDNLIEAGLAIDKATLSVTI